MVNSSLPDPICELCDSFWNCELSHPELVCCEWFKNDNKTQTQI